MVDIRQVVAVVAVALVFDRMNGLHDGCNAVQRHHSDQGCQRHLVFAGLFGAIVGISRKVFRAIMLAWVVTLPFCAISAAITYCILNPVF